MEVGSLAFGKGTCGSWFQFSQALLQSPWLHLVAVVRKIMHRISAGPASQRDVRHQPRFAPSSAWASRCQAAIGSFQAVASKRRLLETMFGVLSTSLLMHRMGGQAMYSQHLVCLREPLVAVVTELLPPLFSEAWSNCVPMADSSQQSSTELLQSAGMRGWSRHPCVPMRLICA